MDIRLERRLLQITVAIACLVPLTAGLFGVVRGSAMIEGVASGAVDLDSHFRYLSGVLLGAGIAFAACIPSLGRRSPTFTTLSGIVILGGFARLLSVATDGVPGPGHLFGLIMELGVVPLLLLWHHKLARRGSRGHVTDYQNAVRRATKPRSMERLE